MLPRCYLENGVTTPKNGKSNTVTPVTPFFLASIGKKKHARALCVIFATRASTFFSHTRETSFWVLPVLPLVKIYIKASYNATFLGNTIGNILVTPKTSVLPILCIMASERQLAYWTQKSFGVPYFWRMAF